MKAKHEYWVDYIKVLACVFVVLGHFFQSLMKAGILHGNFFLNWFNTSIYYFHVPLFFICSGYLYQRYSKVYNMQDWVHNICKKIIVLGVPYFVFSFLTWVLKSLFSGSVNDEIGSLCDVLFLHPASPYWFLYILIFIFFITPNAGSKRIVLIMLIVSLVFKVVGIVFDIDSIDVFFISGLSKNLFWFVLGMTGALYVEKLKNKRVLGVVIGCGFFVGSFWTFNIGNDFCSFGMGIAACVAVVLLLYGCRHNIIMNYLSLYTMPIFLMHTLFAAPVRVFLIKMGVQNPLVHIIIGLLFGFVGPILAMMVLRYTKLDFIVYPRRLNKTAK